MMNLRPQRERSGISQTQLAAALSVSQQAVAKWEKGVGCPMADKLPGIAKMLGCSIDELFSAEEKEAG